MAGIDIVKALSLEEKQKSPGDMRLRDLSVNERIRIGYSLWLLKLLINSASNDCCRPIFRHQSGFRWGSHGGSLIAVNMGRENNRAREAGCWFVIRAEKHVRSRTR